jgi:hypothetical protein
MATVIEDNTTEEQSSVVRFLWVKELNEIDINKECFLLRWELFVALSGP